MEIKICKKCNEEKDINEFRKNRNQCRECERKYAENYRNNNHELTLERTKKWREKNKNKIKKYNKNNRKKYNYEITEGRKIYCKKYMKKWRNDNKKHIKEYKRNSYLKNKENNLYVLKIRVRNLIGTSFKRRSLSKPNKTEKILGCKMEFFINYLLNTFKINYGYEWDGKEPVHIDHINPLKQCNTEEEVIKCCYYTNLQLLKAEDNLKKGGKTDWRLNDD